VSVLHSSANKYISCVGASPVSASSPSGRGISFCWRGLVGREWLGARCGAGRLFIFFPAAAGAGVPFYLLFAYFNHWNRICAH